MDDPPFTYEQIKDHVHDPQALQKDLQKIQDWYDSHAAALGQAAGAEDKELDKIRQVLKEEG